MSASSVSNRAVPAWTERLAPATTNRLQSLLQHAVETVPFYASLKSEKDRPPAYGDFPIISKKRFVDHLEEMMSSLYADYRRVEDPKQAVDAKTLICEFTSGSSGYPLKCYKTTPERAQLALSLYKKRKAIYKDFSNDKMFGFIHNPEFEENSYIDSLGNLSEENIGRVLGYLKDKVQPRVLHGNTMLLLYYADYVRKHRWDLGAWRVEFIESVGEGISEEQKQYIGGQFRTTVYNCYGCLECYNLAYECPHRQLHLNENVLFEIIDPNTGADITDLQTEGEVVLTSLVNRAQPFIRYKTGDLAFLTESTCPCGNPGKIVHLSGRRKIDYIKLLYASADPRLTICGYDIFTTVMHRLVMGGRDDVSWYNVIQTAPDVFQVLYIKKKTFADSFFDLFRQYTREELGMPARIEFVEKEEQEVLLINRKNRVFRSLLQND